ncbi:hypothetical protein N8Z63_03850 [Octadecabacter sp.]|nr:hypothetical protein [Octadecabacter sp.]
MKMLKLNWAWALFLALWPSYSSCDPYSYGATGNAASTALSWGMVSVLPNVPGLDINGLLYRYTTVKNPEDDMKVHVSNKKADASGYIFRETDDWSGVPGNTIVKSFPLANIPATQWGAGSIDIEGKGSVKNAVVIYNYRLDECFDPQSNPNCPGYVKPMPKIPEVEVYVALEDDAVTNTLEADEFQYDDDGNLILSEEEEEEESRIEMGLTASANALTLFKTQGQDDIIMAINQQTNLTMYYNASINGGVYADAPGLADSEIPDNKKALRNNLAQQILHDKMVDMQYNK